MDLPACGLYRTTEPIGDVPANRLVTFHNHGDPGPGIYLPESWHLNRAQFADRGTTLPDESLAFTLEALPPEGLYRVRETFHCCAKHCRTFEPELLVQLGYNAQAEPLLFVPELSDSGLTFPEMGTRVDRDRLAKIGRLTVAGPAPSEGVPAPALH